MIKLKLHLLALLIAAGTFAALPLHAADKSKAPAKAAASPSAAASPEKEMTSAKIPFHGKIASVDKAQKTFTLESKEKTGRTFTVPDSIKITKGADQDASWDDLTAGAEVRGSYKKIADGKLEIVSLKIGAKEEGKSKTLKTDKAEKNAAPSSSPSPAGKSDTKSGEKK